MSLQYQHIELFLKFIYFKIKTINNLHNHHSWRSSANGKTGITGKNPRNQMFLIFHGYFVQVFDKIFTCPLAQIQPEIFGQVLG